VQIAGFADDPYAFASGLSLAPGARIVVARNPTVFEFVYGSGFNIAAEGFGPRNLSNSSELVQLLGPLGNVLQDFTYGSTVPWPTGADGLGSSLEIVDPLGDASDPFNWRASHYAGGSPGASGLPGDYDGNNLVDGDDHQEWTSGFGGSVARGTVADGNRDGVVDAADYVMWRWSMMASSAGSASATPGSDVPQPVSSEASSDTLTMTADAAFAVLSTERTEPNRLSRPPRRSTLIGNESTGGDLLLAVAASNHEVADSDDADVPFGREGKRAVFGPAERESARISALLDRVFDGLSNG
jgi:hypothetical protein